MAGEDPEYLHQLRISVRRSRTVQRQLAPVFPPLELRASAASSAGCSGPPGRRATSTSTCSDFERVRALVPERDPGRPRSAAPGPRPLATGGARRHGPGVALAPRRRAAADWEMLLETLVERPLEDRPRGGQPIGAVAGRRIRKVYTRVRKMGAAIDEASEPAEATTSCARRARSCATCSSCSATQLFDRGGGGRPGAVAQGAPGRARPPPGPRGPGGAAALARRRGGDAARAARGR